MNHKKIVITGASGFLGSHLVKRLKDDGHYMVFAMSSKPNELRDLFDGENVAYVYKDALDAEMLRESIVVNCAYPRNAAGAAVADGLKYTQRVFETAVECGASAIINISSQSVYSQLRTEAATEDTPLCLESTYAVGKYAVELMLESICHGSETYYTNLRMASLIGPGFDQRIVNRFVKQALESGSFRVKRNQQKYGFFDVEDAVGGIVAMLQTDSRGWKSKYNLGGVGTHTLVEIAEIIRDVLAEICGIVVNIEIIDGDEYVNSDLDCTLFYRDYGFAPQVSLSDSVNKITKNLILSKQ